MAGNFLSSRSGDEQRVRFTPRDSASSSASLFRPISLLPVADVPSADRLLYVKSNMELLNPRRIRNWAMADFLSTSREGRSRNSGSYNWSTI